jgi:D-alanyl-D-alanine dipeptidase
MLACAIAVMGCCGSAQAREPAPLPRGFVYLSEMARPDGTPPILQDMKYAGPDNFTGARVPGYEAAECVLLRPVAEALVRAQASLVKHGLSLKVYDCYRPTRAVRSLAAWAETGGRSEPAKRFYPGLRRQALLAGYIARHSAHAQGTTVDLTLVELPVREVPAFDGSARYGDCTGPAGARAPDTSVDMGTGFDCFDARSHTAAKGLSPEQRRWRHMLVEVMQQHGFRNYPREWWHFTFTAQRLEGIAHDFAIVPRTPAREASRHETGR